MTTDGIPYGDNDGRYIEGDRRESEDLDQQFALTKRYALLQAASIIYLDTHSVFEAVRLAKALLKEIVSNG